MPDASLTEAKEAALRRFPSERRAIEALLARSDDFHDMCEELADAERALRETAVMPREVREERAAEWTAMIDRLAAEIARALDEANVVRIGWPTSQRRST